VKLEVAVQKRFPTFSLAADFFLTQPRVGIFGESGSGKSTLVDLIAGLQTPDAGDIVLDGECLFSHKLGINLPPEQRRLAMVFQQAHLFPHLSVQNNLLFGWRRRSARERFVDFDRLVSVLKLGDLLHRGVNHLSGGEQQRVSIGRAMLSNPRLLILDEPLSALDENLKMQIISYLNEIQAAFDIPFLTISHSLLEMRLLTDAVLRIENGKTADLISAEQLARRQMVGSREGYMNLLSLVKPKTIAGLPVYQWGNNELTTTVRAGGETALFELSSKDIILFKQHPEAISARNLFKGTVSGLFEIGNKLGVELDCNGGKLVVEIVRPAAEELGIRVGAELHAAFKASAVKLLGE
jgi:molybdate transport system ATP-binding protein